MSSERTSRLVDAGAALAAGSVAAAAISLAGSPELALLGFAIAGIAATRDGVAACLARIRGSESR